MSHLAARRPRLPPAVALVVGVLAASTASTFIRLAQAEMAGFADASPWQVSLAVAAWRLTLASAILSPFALTTGRKRAGGSIRRDEWVLALGAGILLAGHFAAWITSLALTSVTASVVLVSTNPLFAGLASVLFLKERMGRRMVVGLLTAVIGSAVIGLGDLGRGTHHLTGDMLALAGAVTGAGYFTIGRRLRARLSLLGYVFPVYAAAAAALMGLSLAFGGPLWGYPPTLWLWLLLLALLPQIVGHSSLNWALRHLKTTYVALAVLGEPIGSALLAWLILSEPPPLLAAAGGTLVLAGILLAGREAGEE